MQKSRRAAMPAAALLPVAAGAQGPALDGVHELVLEVADDVGLGKTIEAGLIAAELLAQGAMAPIATGPSSMPLFVIGTLLVGRRRAGWRAQTAVRWTLAGFALLALGYLGSKFALEFVLA